MAVFIMHSQCAFAGLLQISSEWEAKEAIESIQKCVELFKLD